MSASIIPRIVEEGNVVWREEKPSQGVLCNIDLTPQSAGLKIKLSCLRTNEHLENYMR